MIYRVKIGGTVKEFDNMITVFKKYLSMWGLIEQHVEDTITFLVDKKKVVAPNGIFQIVEIGDKQLFAQDAEDIFLILKREVRDEEIKKRITKEECNQLLKMIDKESKKI